MQVIERSVVLNCLSELSMLGVRLWNDNNEVLIRFVVEKIKDDKFYCSINVIRGINCDLYPSTYSMNMSEKFRNDDKFRVALIIPTGLGASVGGHAGDGGATARLMASVCDRLVTHPNVVNASDINEMTENTLYTEGYSLTQYLLGNIGLQEVRQNRVLVIIDGSADPIYIDAAINVVNAARVTYGLNCPEIVVLKNPFTMKTGWSSGGRAAGTIEGMEELFDILHNRKNIYDAVAITSLTTIAAEVRDYYYRNGGVNPWGGVEAMLTHAISHCFQVPCAHAPMMESQEVEQIDFGIVDPRCAAETVSRTYLPCILKGLHRAPQIINSSPDVSCLVIPRRCLGVPMLAAQQRDIPIIAVDDNLEIGSIDCTNYVNAIVVGNYMEAVGAVTALRSGISIESLRRPISKVKVSR
ncbi:MAG: DUF3326 domain-containing protein [Candidatus Heimdallarchaeota archaeon]|nr:MAG: DUF3326 domain-containing protein [Candidatus Heimdallarchaeota archaeon]